MLTVDGQVGVGLRERDVVEVVAGRRAHPARPLPAEGLLLRAPHQAQVGRAVARMPSRIHA